MNGLTASELRKGMEAALDRVTQGGERVLIEHDHMPVAALISADDLALLEALEARLDQEELTSARRELGEDVPWEVLEEELGSE